jgi:hypothetical protein
MLTGMRVGVLAEEYLGRGSARGTLPERSQSNGYNHADSASVSQRQCQGMLGEGRSC